MIGMAVLKRFNHFADVNKMVSQAVRPTKDAAQPGRCTRCTNRKIIEELNTKYSSTTFVVYYE